mmetsp:Transcript_156/g.399  ORF Transcript_156/g.399 Transcript_156/m.399 type:complete len:258 (-) Transcript_156:585-1358(-)
MACLSPALPKLQLPGRSSRCATSLRATWKVFNGARPNPLTNPGGCHRPVWSPGAARLPHRIDSSRGPLSARVRANPPGNNPFSEPEDKRGPLPNSNDKDSREEKQPSTGLANIDPSKKGGIQRMSPSTGMEIVLHAARNEGEIPAAPEDDSLPSRSPRRTKKLRFTCNKCNEKTEAMVNPHALKTGTVFVQCSHCLIHHNVVDNLNLFNDMAGPQYQGDSTFYRRQGGPKGPKTRQADLESLYNMMGDGGWDPSEDI